MCVVAAGAARAQPVPFRPFDQAPYTHPQLLVTLPSGRRLNLYCTGHGRPVVILDYGLGGPHTSWALVQPALSRLTETCSYDRAGQGFSDPGPLPRDSAALVDDLHDLLRAAGIGPPWIFVGHSLAGLDGVLFADRYLEQLAGMVLVDPSFAHQRAQIDAIPGMAETMARRPRPPNVSACETAARLHRLPTDPRLVALCLDHDPHYSAALTRANDAFALNPASWRSVRSEIDSFGGLPNARTRDVDSEELDAARRDFGALDLVVLTAGAKPPPPGLTPAQAAAATRLWIAGHDAIAARSTRGRNRIVPGSGHYIQIDRPEAVIEAVRSVLTDARRH